MARTIALIAHDQKKDDIVAFACYYQRLLSHYHLIATGTTGQRIQNATSLSIECMASGALGGDVQIAAKIVAGEILAVIFLIDPLDTQPHEPDIQALLRVCNLHRVPLATNLGTAEVIIRDYCQMQLDHVGFGSNHQ